MREEKQLLLDDLKEMIEGSDTFVIAQYKKLTCLSSSDLRRTLVANNAELEVVKKRVFVKAAAEAGVNGLNVKEMTGSVAVVLIKDDPIAATKAVCKFADDNQDALEVIGGYFDGKICNGAQVKMLSQLPGKDEMRAQLLGLFEAPMAQTLATMEALLTSVMHCLENKSKADAEQ